MSDQEVAAFVAYKKSPASEPAKKKKKNKVSVIFFSLFRHQL